MTSYQLIGEVAFPTYTWPGAYPLIYLMDDGDVLCASCVNREDSVHFFGDRDGWLVVGVDAHWEGPDEHCAHCNVAIPSAYGEEDQ